MTYLPNRNESQQGFIEIVSAITLVALLIGVTVSTFLVGQRQDIRNRAAHPIDDKITEITIIPVVDDASTNNTTNQTVDTTENTTTNITTNITDNTTTNNTSNQTTNTTENTTVNTTTDTTTNTQNTTGNTTADTTSNQTDNTSVNTTVNNTTTQTTNTTENTTVNTTTDTSNAEQIDSKAKLEEEAAAKAVQELADKEAKTAQEEQQKAEADKVTKARTDAMTARLDKQEKAADDLAALQAQQQADRKVKEDQQAEEDKQRQVIADANARRLAADAEADRKAAEQAARDTADKEESDKQVAEEEQQRLSKIAADNATRQQKEAERQTQQENEAERKQTQVIADANARRLAAEAEADRKAAEQAAIDAANKEEKEEKALAQKVAQEADSITTKTTSSVDTTKYTEPNEYGLSFPIVENDQTPPAPVNKQIDWSFVTAGRGDLGQKLSANLNYAFNPDESQSDYGSRALALTDTLLLGSLSNYLLTNVEQNAQGTEWNDPERLKAAALLGGTAVTEFGVGGAALAYGLPALGVGTAPELSTTVLPALSDAALAAYVKGSMILASAPPVVQTAIQLAGPAGMAVTGYECSQGNQEACAAGFAMGSQYLGELAVSGAESVVNNIKKTPTSEKFEQVIAQVDDFVTYKMGPEASGEIQPRQMGCRRGLCGPQATSGEVVTIADSAGFDAKAVTVRDILSTSGIKTEGAIHHTFNVVDTGEEKYIVDLTYTQFMDPKSRTIHYHDIQGSGISVENPLAQELLTKGYVPLTNDNLAEYLRLSTKNYTGPPTIDVSILDTVIKGSDVSQYYLRNTLSNERISRVFNGIPNSK